MSRQALPAVLALARGRTLRSGAQAGSGARDPSQQSEGELDRWSER